jgi:histidinol-phosphatase (PHP family)
MQKIDYHIHSSFSPDSTEEPEGVVRAAIALGVSHIAFTDHLDLNTGGLPPEGMRDLKLVLDTFDALKEKYRGKIHIAAGLECGWSKHHEQVIVDMIGGLKFDYTINSIHDVNGKDCYRPDFYKGRSKQTAYAEYFGAVLDSLDALYPYHTVGHLGYAERVATYEDTRAYYKEFAYALDPILKKVIQKGKILELNTAVLYAKIPCLPAPDILKRYKELGGTKITFASDAHTANRLCDGYDKIVEIAKTAGFAGFTVVEDGKEKLISFD